MYKGTLALIILFLSLNGPVRSAQLEDAVTAAHRGDYMVARQLLGPLAEKDDARAQFNIGYLYANGWVYSETMLRRSSGIVKRQIRA
jgi:hypothetical protein